MPAGNPFAPLIDVGGNASAGPVSGSFQGGINVGSAQVGDHHVAASTVLVGLAILYLLHKRRWRFSTRVG
jgi:hypothetical protein